ncbi:MAG: sodium:solute symporter [Bradymonadaceae bacterium]
MSLDFVLWIAMAVYGAAMFLLSPLATTPGEFFAAEDARGRDLRFGFLVGTVVISWLFAKSITNAANLGARFGMVGPVAYAGWYLTIPVVGAVVYHLRVAFGATSLAEFVTAKYGRPAALGFMIAISVRLFNEIWSNTAVVAAYFGAEGTWSYVAAAAAFASLTLAYSLRGGLRSSVFTDVFQCGMAMLLLVFALGLVVPDAGFGASVSSGEWRLSGGLDLLLVGLLQSLSYGFHDPVLTDRAFLTDPRETLRGYLLAGLLAGGFIVLFGLIGVHARVTGLTVGQDAPIRVAETFGVAVLAGMSVMMMLSAGSTLDSTLSSLSKAVVSDLGGVETDGSRRSDAPLRAVARLIEGRSPVRVGRIAMVVTAVAGFAPLLAGAEILQATTISGTMVLGLAPVFLLASVERAGPGAFHGAFWPGIALGVAHVGGWLPPWLAVGGGEYADLLGVNLAGTVLVFAGFALGTAVDASLQTDGRSDL